MLMHCDNLLDNFDWNIRKPASKKRPVQARADHETRKASERIQDQPQESQSTSSDSDKQNINFNPSKFKYLEEIGRDKKRNQTTEVIFQAI